MELAFELGLAAADFEQATPGVEQVGQGLQLVGRVLGWVVQELGLGGWAWVVQVLAWGSVVRELEWERVVQPLGLALGSTALRSVLALTVRQLTLASERMAQPLGLEFRLAMAALTSAVRGSALVLGWLVQASGLAVPGLGWGRQALVPLSARLSVQGWVARLAPMPVLLAKLAWFLRQPPELGRWSIRPVRSR